MTWKILFSLTCLVRSYYYETVRRSIFLSSLVVSLCYTLFFCVTLSDNDLVGTIPKDFLSGLSYRDSITVDLSSNSLKGSLPLELDRLDQLTIYLSDNEFTELSPKLCDSDNQGWNSRDVKFWECDAIMCPPGTANHHGRQSSQAASCMKCASNTKYYGQTTCDGMFLEASSSSHLLQGGVVMLISSLLFVGKLMF